MALLASNTPHIVFDELHQQSPIPFISIVDATCAAATGMSRLALFGTRFTVQADIYRPRFLARGIEVIAPNDIDLNFIHTKYFTGLVSGQFFDETRRRLLEIAERMRSEQHIDGVILGGTELPLLLPDGEVHGLRFLTPRAFTRNQPCSTCCDNAQLEWMEGGSTMPASEDNG